MKFLALPLLVMAFAASAAELLPAPVIASPAAVPPALYSFTDVYRLTVGRAPVGLPQAQATAEAPMRVAAVADAAAIEPSFSVRQFPAPERWLLALAGLALAGWVAHRRLSYL
ncbi:MAG: hypothetical protein QOD26_3554 [Betaproteobacteria bacterium]|jgi:hypothetical protein|nr:hypothetical protein [Betaproteobacteria bacterium]